MIYPKRVYKVSNESCSWWSGGGGDSLLQSHAHGGGGDSFLLRPTPRHFYRGMPPHPPFLYFSLIFPSFSSCSVIIELMQAQAQALYYQKCVETPAARLTKGNEKKKNILCSKLAQKAVELYTLAREQLETPTLKAIVNKAWNEHITYQIHVFMAMSQYKQSEVDHETAEENAEGYGIELGRLAYAERQCTLALTLATQLKMTEQKEGATSLLSKITSRYRERKTDNVRTNGKGCCCCCFSCCCRVFLRTTYLHLHLLISLISLILFRIPFI